MYTVQRAHVWHISTVFHRSTTALAAAALAKCTAVKLLIVVTRGDGADCDCVEWPSPSKASVAGVPAGNTCGTRFLSGRVSRAGTSFGRCSDTTRPQSDCRPGARWNAEIPAVCARVSVGVLSRCSPGRTSPGEPSKRCTGVCTSGTALRGSFCPSRACGGAGVQRRKRGG